MAYIFDPDNNGPRNERPSKRRRVSKQAAAAVDSIENASVFTPLLNGAETSGFVQLREAAFHESWGKIDDRIKVCDLASTIRDSAHILRVSCEAPTRQHWTK